jgi:putative transposase
MGDCVYFLTLCLENGQRGLDNPALFDASVKLLQGIEKTASIEMLALVHMPDHLHLLIRLSQESRLPNLVRIFKGRMSPTLRKSNLRWQRSYHDRRLRKSDPIDVVLRYMLMNPYRKGLLDPRKEWPYLICSPKAKHWLDQTEGTNLPLPEWLL